jgi:hypothetical protein
MWEATRASAGSLGILLDASLNMLLGEESITLPPLPGHQEGFERVGAHGLEPPGRVRVHVGHRYARM